MSDYPEHDKLAEVKDRSHAIGEFLDYCGYILAEWAKVEVDPDSLEILRAFGANEEPVGQVEDRLIPVRMSIQEVLAEYFHIDQTKLEAEKRQMLTAMSEQ